MTSLLNLIRSHLRNPAFWEGYRTGCGWGALIGLGVLIGLLVASASAATFTTVNAPPPGEGNTLSIVAAICPECERVPDDLDIDFLQADGFFIFAFEDAHDIPYFHSDFDYNDLIVEAWFEAGTLAGWSEIARYSVASQSFGFDGRYVFDSATGPPYVSTVLSAPWLNADGLDHLITFTRPAGPTPIPEPSPWLPVLGCLAVAWWTWRGRR